jgi:glycosyltransferase 2 family protein
VLKSKNRLKGPLLAIVSVGVSVLLTAWLITRVDLAQLSKVLRTVDWYFFAAALCCATFTPFLSAFRCQGILMAQKNITASYGLVVRGTMMAMILNSVLPSKGGDLAKVYYFRRHIGTIPSAGTVVLERMVDLFILGLVALVGSFLNDFLWSMLVGASLMLLVIGAFATLAFLPLERWISSQKLVKIAGDFRAVFSDWIKRPSAIAITFVGSAAIWTCGAAIIYLLIRATGYVVTISYIAAIYPVSILAGLMPISVSGIGVRDAALVSLLRRHVPLEAALIVSFGYTMLTYWFLSLLGLPVLFRDIIRYFRSRRSYGNAPESFEEP